MTEAEVIAAITTDASVRETHRRTGPGGTIVETPVSELQAIARTSLTQVLSELMLTPSIADQLFEHRYTLTLTSATRYNIGQYKITKVREVLTGSDDRPIRPFFEDSGDFYEWRERRYGGADMSGLSEPTAIYISGRPGGELEMTFWPTMGTESSVTIVHNKLPSSPLSLASFPDHVHGIILTGAIRFANGGSQGYSDQWEQIKSNLIRGLDPVRGTTSKLRKSDTLRRFLRRQNSLVSGASSSFPSSSKSLE